MSTEIEELTRLPKNDPTELFRCRDGIYAPELVAAAVTELDFFTWLAKSPADGKAISVLRGLAERPVDVMLTLFRAMGLVEKRGEVFHPTETAREFLVRDSPRFLGPYYSSLLGRPGCRELLAALRSGKPGGWASGEDERPWAQSMEHDAFAQQFTSAMDSRGLNLGPVLARRLELKGRKHLLDIAGGSGIYACCIVAAHSQIKATVFEKPPVDRVARGCIANRGCSGRVNVSAGDIFDGPLPSGFDVHLWSNALHDWNEPAVRALLEKSFAALPPGGLVVIHDAHINREKTGPLSTAAYSVFLMVTTEGKCYSIGEMEGFLDDAGFGNIQYYTSAADHSVITARKPGRQVPLALTANESESLESG
jgi:SAM-dependent methyltransferase